ncbi:MAG: class I tRNA ligase family protein, partial [Clostridiales bacterium]|nr:class I tRNA ligase family protein [Clostridiales bacterium]
ETNALPEKLELEDKWILSKLNTVIREVTENMDHYELGVAAQKIYDFIWDTYCDWYIEMTKARLQGDDPAAKEQAQRVLCYVLTDILKLLHPFMPFLTEEIWQALPHEAGNEVKFLMLQDWPKYREDLAFPQEEKAVELLMEAVKAVRARRSEMNVPPSKKAHLTIATLEQDIFSAGIPFLKRLGYASDVTVTGPSGLGSDKEEAARGVVIVITHVARIGMPLAELVDLEKERARIAKELKKNKGELEKLTNKLQNPGFLNKAPENVVKAEQERAEKLTALIAQLEEQAKGL